MLWQLGIDWYTHHPPGAGWSEAFSWVYDGQVGEAEISDSRAAQFICRWCCSHTVPFLGDESWHSRILWCLLTIDNTNWYETSYTKFHHQFKNIVDEDSGVPTSMDDPRCIPALETAIREVDAAYDSCNEAWARGEADKFRSSELLIWIHMFQSIWMLANKTLIISTYKNCLRWSFSFLSWNMIPRA